MSERENFLARWSRRKRDAGEATPPAVADTPAATQADEKEVDAARAPIETAALPSPEPPLAPAVDLAKLPAIDSITAATDIRPFLAAGIPEELKRAALRRAWVADPAIRDFVGLAENQWDFTVSGGAPGFGSLLPTDDVRRLVADIFGGKRDDAARDVTQPQADAQESPVLPGAVSAPASAGASEHADAVAPAAPATQPSVTQAEGMLRDGRQDIAMQNNSEEEGAKRPSGRRHGSALPE
jgi:hypothetical protein